MKRHIHSVRKFAGNLLLASFFVVPLLTSCSEEDEMITPATNTAMASQAETMAAKGFDPVSYDATTLESQFYPNMPAGSMIYIAHAGCNGTCPAYTISVTGKGIVTYTGFRNVGTTGRYVYAVGQELANRLAERMLSMGFLTFSDQYPYQVDASMVVTGLNIARSEPKLVIDYGIKIPAALTSMRAEIEMTLGIDRLIRIPPGAAETPLSLSGEF